jgi:hypothetical protein
MGGSLFLWRCDHMLAMVATTSWLRAKEGRWEIYQELEGEMCHLGVLAQ